MLDQQNIKVRHTHTHSAYDKQNPFLISPGSIAANRAAATNEIIFSQFITQFMSRTQSALLAYRAPGTLTCKCPLNDAHRSALGPTLATGLMQLYHLRHSYVFIRTRAANLVAFIIPQ